MLTDFNLTVPKGPSWGLSAKKAPARARSSIYCSVFTIPMLVRSSWMGTTCRPEHPGFPLADGVGQSGDRVV